MTAAVIIPIETYRTDLAQVDEAIGAIARAASVSLSEAERAELRAMIRLGPDGNPVATLALVEAIRAHVEKPWGSWGPIDEIIETMLAGPIGGDAA